VPYTFTLNASGGTAPYTWTVTQGSLPAGLTLNQFTGVISGTPTTQGTYTYTVQVQDVNGITQVKTFTTSVTTAMSVTTSTLAAWTQGAPGYSQTLAATGGSGTYTWSITAGSGAGTAIPAPGLTLNPVTGAITGTPTTAGTYTFTVTATDTSVPALAASKQVSIVVNQPLAITTATIPDAVQGAFFQRQLATSGGTSPLLWAVTAGALPAGLSLDSLTGVISGIPTTAGPASDFTVTATDASGATASAQLALTVDAPGSNSGGNGSNTPPPSSGGKSGGGCFIATAAYGSYLDPHVMVLRHFRDEVLLKSRPGTAFVHLYYRYSPPVADFIRLHPFLRLCTRWALTPLIFAVKYPLSLLALAAWLIHRFARKVRGARRFRQVLGA
jgi:hypothetical protein